MVYNHTCLLKIVTGQKACSKHVKQDNRFSFNTPLPKESTFGKITETKILFVFLFSYIGPLGIVDDLNYIFLNGSSVLLSWTAPYTLDNVPITGYNINDGYNNIITNNTNNTLSATDPNPCILNNISVTAINGAGIGEPNNISFYYEKG